MHLNAKRRAFGSRGEGLHEHATTCGTIRKNRIGNVQRVLDDELDRAIEPAVHIEIEVGEWLRPRDGVVAIVESHREDGGHAWRDAVGDVKRERGESAEVGAERTPVEPEVGDR